MCVSRRYSVLKKPRVTRTPAKAPSAGTHPGEHTDEILGELARRTAG
jgi:hypothetical protein